jgi:hypothetical protein
MTRLALVFVLLSLAVTACKDSSTHSHGDEEHAHEGDDSHAGDKKKSEDPPTKEVPVPDPASADTAAKATPSDAGTDAKAAPSGDVSSKEKPANPTTDQGSDKDSHKHGQGQHTH